MAVAGFSLLDLLAIPPALAWMILLAARGGFWRMRPAALPSGAPPRRVAAIVPARNEAAGVERAVASLAGQQFAGDFRIFLVDDASTDGTADLARHAAPSDKLSVAPAPPLAPGWTGKLWAMAEGVRAAAPLQPDYYWLTDADIVQSPGALDRLVRHAETGGYDLVSFMVKLRCESPAERLLIPAFVFFFLKLYPPAWIADPRRRTAGAAGGSILVRREALERIGGVEAIRGEMIDDCALAGAVKRTGDRVWLGLTTEDHSVREYRSFGEIGRMISRTAFTELRRSWWLLAGTVLGMAALYLLPVALALSGSALGALAWLLMALAYAPAVRFYGRSLLWAPALPFAALFYTGATIHSALRGGSWKGRPAPRV
jgi:hopene-associated glycosyltransferase HpnB